MFKFLLVPLLAVVLLVQSIPTSHRKLVDRVSSSTVRITGVIKVPLWVDTVEVHETVCTGFVISHNLVMTAAHCLSEDLKVDGTDAQVVKADAFYDLALLITKSNKASLPFRVGAPNRYEPLTAIGYANGWEKLTALDVKPFLINFTPSPNLPPSIYVQGAYTPGMSGGPVVDDDGNVVSIIQRTNVAVGMGLGSELMQAFLIGVN